jgi:hypothetical protein
MGVIGANPDDSPAQNAAERIARGTGGGIAGMIVPEAAIGTLARGVKLAHEIPRAHGQFRSSARQRPQLGRRQPLAPERINRSGLESRFCGASVKQHEPSASAKASAVLSSRCRESGLGAVGQLVSGSSITAIASALTPNVDISNAARRRVPVPHAANRHPVHRRQVLGRRIF